MGNMDYIQRAQQNHIKMQLRNAEKDKNQEDEKKKKISLFKFTILNSSNERH